ncbi:hypothetical protein DPMN_173668 [Dreissena polymorpha]|uniref:Uncharacterized protein n=1 Tax=Dreissena polymorpha TaxID=45954 RepID=A0A9D4E4Q1_DREPO|nr:hypothetical protein DPMN_173668 [Dreissena polymorpha]
MEVGSNQSVSGAKALNDSDLMQTIDKGSLCLPDLEKFAIDDTSSRSIWLRMAHLSGRSGPLNLFLTKTWHIPI